MASMPSSSLLENITKLNGYNWPIYISQIKKVLITIDADEIITGAETEPAKTAQKKD